MNSASTASHQSPRSLTSRGTPIVFVVDDDISVRESLESLILFAGVAAADIRFRAGLPPSPTRPRTKLPVLDVMLPDLNGLDLQKRLATDRVTMPIIFITGHSDVPMAVRAMKAGPWSFLNKPYSDETLLSAIQEALELQRRCTVS